MPKITEHQPLELDDIPQAMGLRERGQDQPAPALRRLNRR
jgi:hypothetical protein